MKRIFKNGILVLIMAIAIFACDKESDKELNDNVDFCLFMNLEDINQTTPLVNEFLAELPADITYEQRFKSLETWLNSFPCDVNAKILYGIDLIGGEEQMRGVSISVKDGEITRDLELDFAIIDNAVTFSQIAGYLYYKQDAIYVKTLFTEIDTVFEFINSLNLAVKEIQGGTYLSSMSATTETLQYIINKLRAKPYTTDSWVTGHLNWYNENITVFIRLYDMKNTIYQTDWIETMSEYKLENYTNGSKHTIVFYILEGTGEEWETIFTEYDFIDWAELSYTKYIIR